MKEPGRPDPLAAAQRVKDLALDLAQDVADGYRRSTRHFKLRAAVIGAWSLLSAVTLVLACPSSSGPDNALGAVVHLSEDDPANHQVMVQNTSDEIWTDVTLTLEGGWKYHTSAIRNGEAGLVLATRQFTKGGVEAPGDLRPRTVTVECGQGDVTAQLGGR